MTAVKNKELVKRQQLSKSVSDASELEKQSQLTDEEILETIASEVKKRKEAIEQFKQAGVKNWHKRKSEMDILIGVSPEQMSEEDIRTEIQKTITELNASSVKDMGKVIGAVMAKLKGRADGGLVSKIAKELLG